VLLDLLTKHLKIQKWRNFHHLK